MTSDSNRKYEITNFRKQNMLRLRKYLNEVLLDQLPMLAALLRGLEEMNLMGEAPVAGTNSFIVQTLPEIRTNLLKGKDWKRIASLQAASYWKPGSEQEKSDMDRLVKLYASEVFEDFMEEPICEECGEPATQRCSRCKLAWYCSRDCQMRQWKKHKKLCNMFVEKSKNLEEKEEMVKETQKAAAAQQRKKPLI